MTQVETNIVKTQGIEYNIDDCMLKDIIAQNSFLYDENGKLKYNVITLMKSFLQLETADDCENVIKGVITDKKIKTDNLEKNEGVRCAANHLRTLTEEVYKDTKIESYLNMNLINNLLDEDSFYIKQEIFTNIITGVKESENGTTFVEGCILYVPKGDECLKLSKKQFYSKVMECAVWRTDLMPLDFSRKILKCLLSVNALVWLDNKDFDQLYKYAINAKMSVVELIESYGFNYVKYNDVKSEFGYFYAPCLDGTILVDFGGVRVPLSREVFKSFYELDMLRNAYALNGKVYIDHEGGTLELNDFMTEIEGK